MALGHIISTVGVKGGAGKSTVCYLLAQELRHRGHSVAVLDLDPNHPFLNLQQFRREAGMDDLCTIYGVPEINEKTFFAYHDKVSASHDFTLIDCEGSQNFLLTKAASVSSMTILPVKHSPLDVWSLPVITNFVEEQSRVMRRPLPYRTLVNFTADGAVTTQWERQVIDDLDTELVPRFQTLLFEGIVFKDMWGEVSTLYELQEAAISNNSKELKLKRIAKGIDRMQAICDELFTFMQDDAQAA